MTCTDCEKAVSDRNWAIYRKACRGCTIRMFANGLAFLQSKKAKKMLPAYQKALQSEFGEKWESSHDEIKAMKASNPTYEPRKKKVDG